MDFDFVKKKHMNNRNINNRNINNRNINRNIDINTLLKKFNNQKLKKIVNVYQLEYVNGKSPGLGDFLRGCFCFIQLAKLLNLEFDLNILNHPISKYTENLSDIKNINYNNILHYQNYNRNLSVTEFNIEKSRNNLNVDFLENTINLLNEQNCEIYYLFSNAFPLFDIYPQPDKNIINLRLTPNNDMNKYIDLTLDNFNLSKKEYGTIHVRCGDEYISNGIITNNNFILKIKAILNKIVVPEFRYLIISDSNYLKEQLKMYKNFYIMINDIEHLGGEAIKSTNSNGIMNTMLEYYLMSYSNVIISLSVYDHVSGFSKYCSVLNNIPFQYFKINR
jgi:hypothetical protein